MAKQRYWVVSENVPGYLPEGDPFFTDSRSAAEDYARELVEQAREGGYTVTGSAKRGGYMAYRKPKTPHDLGLSISIDEISRADYERESEGAYRHRRKSAARRTVASHPRMHSHPAHPYSHPVTAKHRRK